MNETLYIKTYEGNLTFFPVQVRYLGSKVPPDLTGASIKIEWEDESGVHMAPIDVLPTVPGAIWSTGLVMLPIGPNDITAAIGHVTFSLTIEKDGQTVTYRTGVIEVAERPGYPPP